MSSLGKAVERLYRQGGGRRADPGTTPEAVKPTTGKQDLKGKVTAPPIYNFKPEVRLNFKTLAQRGFLTPDTMHESLAEQYRMLKRPLLRNASQASDVGLKNCNLIAIMSGSQGEGKTFTTLNLAMSINFERDLTVLLVDTDLVARSLTKMVGLNSAPGLADFLADKRMDLGDVIVKTNIPKLNLIPAGRAGQDATELLASKRMHDVVEEISTRYADRITLFDTSPILAASQALVLGSLVGQIVVVVEEGKTVQHSLETALSALDQDKAISLVLNKASRSSGEGYYPSYRVGESKESHGNSAYVGT